MAPRTERLGQMDSAGGRENTGRHQDALYHSVGRKLAFLHHILRRHLINPSTAE